MSNENGRFQPSKKYNHNLDEAKVVEMYNSGQNCNVIAKQMGSYPKKIQTILKKNNVKFRIKACYASGPSNPKYTGYEELQGAYLAAVKAQAKRRNIEYSISNKYLWDLFIQQNRKCAYSGIEIFLSRNNLEHITGDYTASIDRIDSSKGYVEGNVQWVHKRVNVMKGNMCNQEFFDFCEAIILKNKGQEIQKTFSHTERK